jgi:hypothetical protein
VDEDEQALLDEEFAALLQVRFVGMKFGGWRVRSCTSCPSAAPFCWSCGVLAAQQPGPERVLKPFPLMLPSCRSCWQRVLRQM